MHTVKITTVGNSAGIVLPREIMARMKVRKGDVLILTEADGGYQVTPYDPAFARQVEAAEEGMRQYRNALRELAK